MGNRNQLQWDLPALDSSRLDWQTLLLTVVFANALFAFTRWYWRVRLRNYIGSSA